MKLGRGMQGVGWSGQAFTRIDLIVLMFIVCLGVALANPLFISPSRARSDTLVCQDNLRQIGRAYQIWGNDHEDLPPFLVSTNEGGLRLHELRGNAYIQFAWISNGLPSPKVLVCPADTNTTRRARDFSFNPDGGFMHPAYRNSAVSYMLSFHAQRYLPRSILNGDRNVEPLVLQPCPYAGAPAVRTIQAQGTAGSYWSQQIHWEKGNLLFMDGSVEETSSAQLRALVISNDDVVGGVSGAIHILAPK